MKMNKKKVFVIALAVCLIAILSAGTLAWFNASDDITNKFLIADSDGDGTPDFSVEVWENETDGDDTADADGDGDNKITHAGNEYANIAPGDEIAKNPTVENTGDYDQWIRVYVTFDEWSTIKAACERTQISTDLRAWLDVVPGWTAGADSETVIANNQITYVYYLNNKLVKDDTAILFTTITIPAAFEQEDMRFVSGDFSVTVKAQAIQAANTGETAQEAFANCWEY